MDAESPAQNNTCSDPNIHQQLMKAIMLKVQELKVQDQIFERNLSMFNTPMKNYGQLCSLVDVQNKGNWTRWKICIDVFSLLKYYIRLHPQLQQTLAHKQDLTSNSQTGNPHHHNTNNNNNTNIKNISSPIPSQCSLCCSFPSETSKHFTQISKILHIIYSCIDPSECILLFPSISQFLILQNQAYDFGVMAKLDNFVEVNRDQLEGVRAHGGVYRAEVGYQYLRWCSFVFQNLQIRLYPEQTHNNTVNIQQYFNQSKQNSQSRTNKCKENSPKNLNEKVPKINSSHIYQHCPRSYPELELISTERVINQQYLHAYSNKYLEFPQNEKFRTVQKLVVPWLDTQQFTNNYCYQQIRKYSDQGYVVLTWNQEVLTSLTNGFAMLGLDLSQLDQSLVAYDQFYHLSELINNNCTEMDSNSQMNLYLSYQCEKQKLKNTLKTVQKNSKFLFHTPSPILTSPSTQLHRIYLREYTKLFIDLNKYSIENIISLRTQILHPRYQLYAMAQYLLGELIHQDKWVKQVINGTNNCQDFRWKIKTVYQREVQEDVRQEEFVYIPLNWEQTYHSLIPQQSIKNLLSQNDKKYQPSLKIQSYQYLNPNPNCNLNPNSNSRTDKCTKTTTASTNNTLSNQPLQRERKDVIKHRKQAVTKKLFGRKGNYCADDESDIDED